MKLVRYGNPGKEKPGLIDAAGKLRDLSKVIADVTQLACCIDEAWFFFAGVAVTHEFHGAPLKI